MGVRIRQFHCSARPEDAYLTIHLSITGRGLKDKREEEKEQSIFIVNVSVFKNSFFPRHVPLLAGETYLSGPRVFFFTVLSYGIAMKSCVFRKHGDSAAQFS